MKQGADSEKVPHFNLSASVFFAQTNFGLSKTSKLSPNRNIEMISRDYERVLTVLASVHLQVSLPPAGAGALLNFLVRLPLNSI